ncbi:MAG: hypothetical protein IKA31_01115 [Clostridia bacterium]|nr:hypothetical protein [Clostridia bacterium]
MQDENNKKEQIVTQLTLYINKILTIEQQPTINYDEAFILCNEAYLYVLQNNELNSYFNELKNRGLKFIESKKYNKFIATVIRNNNYFFSQISEEYVNEQFKTNPVLIDNLTIILKTVGIETVLEDYNYANLLIFIQDKRNYFSSDVEKFGMIFYTLLDMLKSFSYGYLNLQPEVFNKITPKTVEHWDKLTNEMIDIINNETISNKIFLWNTQYKNRLLPNLSKYQKEDTIKLFVYILEYLRNHFAKETVMNDYKMSKITPRTKKISRLEYIKTTDRVYHKGIEIKLTPKEKSFLKLVLTNIDSINKREYKDTTRSIEDKLELKIFIHNRQGKIILDKTVIEIFGFEYYTQ